MCGRAVVEQLGYRCTMQGVSVIGKAGGQAGGRALEVMYLEGGFLRLDGQTGRHVRGWILEVEVGRQGKQSSR